MIASFRLFCFLLIFLFKLSFYNKLKKLVSLNTIYKLPANFHKWAQLFAPEFDIALTKS